jgi:hypothetical protein
MRYDHLPAACILAVIWALCALVPGAVRRALLNGARCSARYSDLWRLPALFGFGYVIFQLGATALFHARMGENVLRWLTTVAWMRPISVPLLPESWLPASEQTVSVFNIFVATFPISAIFAFLLLINSGGVFNELTRALTRRLGRGGAALIVVLLVISALAAIVKPVAFLMLPEIAERVSVLIPQAVNLLSCVFELLLGIYFLTYLMLVAFAWLRGIHFNRHRLRMMALRRTGFVLKWSLLVAGLATLLIILPGYAGLFVASGDSAASGGQQFATYIGKPFVTIVALVFCPVQAILVFHNESLRQALRDSIHLMRTKWLLIVPFLVVVFIPYLCLEMASNYLLAGFGRDSAAGLGSGLLVVWVEALVAGWLIASWVCLYKGLNAGRKDILF